MRLDTHSSKWYDHIVLQPRARALATKMFTATLSVHRQPIIFEYDEWQVPYEFRTAVWWLSTAKLRKLLCDKAHLYPTRRKYIYAVLHARRGPKRKLIARQLSRRQQHDIHWTII